MPTTTGSMKPRGGDDQVGSRAVPSVWFASSLILIVFWRIFGDPKPLDLLIAMVTFGCIGVLTCIHHLESLHKRRAEAFTTAERTIGRIEATLDRIENSLTATSLTLDGISSRLDDIEAR